MPEDLFADLIRRNYELQKHGGIVPVGPEVVTRPPASQPFMGEPLGPGSVEQSGALAMPDPVQAGGTLAGDARRSYLAESGLDVDSLVESGTNVFDNKAVVDHYFQKGLDERESIGKWDRLKQAFTRASNEQRRDAAALAAYTADPDDIAKRAMHMSRLGAVDYKTALAHDIDPEQDLSIAEYKKRAEEEGSSGGDYFYRLLEKMPFIGGASSMARMGNIAGSMKAVNEGYATEWDKYRIAKFITEEERRDDGKFFGVEVPIKGQMAERAFNIATDMPAYLVELAATGIVGPAGPALAAGRFAAKKATTKTVTKLVNNAVRQVAKRELRQAMIANTLKKVSARSVANAAAGTGRLIAKSAAAPAHPAMYPALSRNFASHIIDNYEVAPDDAGNLEVLLKDNAESTYQAFFKAYGDTAIEVFSEGAGGAFNHLGRAVKRGILNPRLAKKISEMSGRERTLAASIGLFGRGIHSGRWNPQRILGVAAQRGYDGVLAEMLEERVGDVARVITGVSDGDIKEALWPGWEQLITEGLGFMLYSQGMARSWNGFQNIVGTDKALTAKRAKQDREQAEKQHKLDKISALEHVHQHKGDYHGINEKDVLDAADQMWDSLESGEAMEGWGNNWNVHSISKSDVDSGPWDTIDHTEDQGRAMILALAMGNKDADGVYGIYKFKNPSTGGDVYAIKRADRSALQNQAFQSLPRMIAMPGARTFQSSERAQETQKAFEEAERIQKERLVEETAARRRAAEDAAAEADAVASAAADVALADEADVETAETTQQKAEEKLEKKQERRKVAEKVAAASEAEARQARSDADIEQHNAEVAVEAARAALPELTSGEIADLEALAAKQTQRGEDTLWGPATSELLQQAMPDRSSEEVAELEKELAARESQYRIIKTVTESDVARAGAASAAATEGERSARRQEFEAEQAAEKAAREADLAGRIAEETEGEALKTAAEASRKRSAADKAAEAEAYAQAVSAQTMQAIADALAADRQIQKEVYSAAAAALASVGTSGEARVEDGQYAVESGAGITFVEAASAGEMLRGTKDINRNSLKAGLIKEGHDAADLEDMSDEALIDLAELTGISARGIASSAGEGKSRIKVKQDLIASADFNSVIGHELVHAAVFNGVIPVDQMVPLIEEMRADLKGVDLSRVPVDRNTQTGIEEELAYLIELDIANGGASMGANLITKLIHNITANPSSAHFLRRSIIRGSKLAESARPPQKKVEVKESEGQAARSEDSPRRSKQPGMLLIDGYNVVFKSKIDELGYMYSQGETEEAIRAFVAITGIKPRQAKTILINAAGSAKSGVRSAIRNAKEKGRKGVVYVARRTQGLDPKIEEAFKPSGNRPVSDEPKASFGLYEPSRSAQAVHRKHAPGAQLPKGFLKINLQRAKDIADAYESAQNQPSKPAVLRSYTALGEEVLAQLNAVLESGIVLEPFEGNGEPYATAKEMIADVESGHMYYLATSDDTFQTSDPDNNNVLLQPTGIELGGRPVLYNDAFRIVHDYFGHAVMGNGFGPRGEETAWAIHAAMFSDEARPAMTAETRGQNSWVNFGPHMRRDDGTVPERGDPDFVPFNRREFADQKNTTLPAWASKGYTDIDGTEVVFAEAKASMAPEITSHGEQGPAGTSFESKWRVGMRKMSGNDFIVAPPANVMKWSTEWRALKKHIADRLESPLSRKAWSDAKIGVSRSMKLGKILENPQTKDSVFLSALAWNSRATKEHVFNHESVSGIDQAVMDLVDAGEYEQARQQTSDAAVSFWLSKGRDGVPHLQWLRSEYQKDSSGKEIRAGLVARAPDADLAALSTFLLTAGKPQVVILDRVQTQSMWGAESNIYDPAAEGQWLSSQNRGETGDFMASTIEDALRSSVERAYGASGASTVDHNAVIGHFNWFNWLASAAKQKTDESAAMMRGESDIPSTVSYGASKTDGMYRMIVPGTGKQTDMTQDQWVDFRADVLAMGDKMTPGSVFKAAQKHGKTTHIGEPAPVDPDIAKASMGTEIEPGARVSLGRDDGEFTAEDIDEAISEPQEGIGRGQTSEDQATERTQQAIDERYGRSEGVKADETLRDEAQALLDDADAMVNIVERAENGDPLSDAEQMALQRFSVRSTAEAIRSKDANAIKQAVRLRRAYTDAGTTAGRSLRARRMLFSEGEFNTDMMLEHLLIPTGALQRKIKAKQKALNNARTQDERDTLDAELTRLEEQNIKALDSILKRMEKMGLDLKHLTPEDMQDPGTAIRIANIAKQEKAGLADMIMEWWYNSILSAPTTHFANIIGNTANATWELGPQRMLEAALNMVIPGAKDKKLQAANFSDYKYILPNLFNVKSSKSALQKSWAAAKLGHMMFEVEHGMPGYGATEGRGPAIGGGKVGEAIRMPMKSLLFADEFAKRTIGHGLVGAIAEKKGKLAGLEGEALAEFVRKEMEDELSDSWLEASYESKDIVFQEQLSGPLGDIQNFLVKFREKNPWAGFFVPFVQTPMNIFVKGVRKSPIMLPVFGLRSAITVAGRFGIMKDSRLSYKSRAKMIKDAANAVFATAIIMTIYQWILPDEEDGMPLVTGSTDYKDLEGNRVAPKFSVRIGDTWYSYARIEPFATTLGLLVDGVQKYHETGSVARSSVFAGTSILRQMEDKTFVSGIGDLMGLINAGTGVDSDEQRIKTFVKTGTNIFAGFVPNVVKSATRATSDQGVKETRVHGDFSTGTFWDRYAPALGDRLLPGVNMPFLSQHTVKRDVYGREMKYSPDLFVEDKHKSLGDVAWQILLPIRTQRINEDDRLTDFDMALYRWNHTVADKPQHFIVPQVTFRKGDHYYRIEDAGLYDDYLKLSGELYKDYLLNRSNIDPTKDLTEREVKKMDDLRKRAARKARTELFSDLEELMRQKKLSITRKGQSIFETPE